MINKKHLLPNYLFLISQSNLYAKKLDKKRQVSNAEAKPLLLAYYDILRVDIKTRIVKNGHGI